MLPAVGVVRMQERHITVERRMSAPLSSVWELFADFPHLASHWKGLRSSTPLGDQTRGVGARRVVALKPVGTMTETVTTWEEGHRIGTRNQPSASVPITWASSSLVFESDGDGTMTTFDYTYVPRGGPLGRLTGPLIDRMLTRTFEDMLAATDKAASAR